MFNFMKKNKEKEDKSKNEFEFYLSKIEDETIKEYISKRVIGQINWYSEKSSYNQNKYKHLNVISICISIIIPGLSIISDFHWAIKFAIAILSSGVAGISSIMALFNYKDIWVQYRISCETLKSNLILYFTHQNQYKDLDEDEAFSKLISSCEAHFTKEFSEWRLTLVERDKKCSV